MEFRQQEWLGSWVNFETYLSSTEPAMVQCWQEAEAAAGTMPMFQQGVKQFWTMACDTVKNGNAVRLSGWHIQPMSNGLIVQWFGTSGEDLGTGRYFLKEIVSKGLEGKENYLFEATDAPADWPFRYLLAMEPMPDRSEKEKGGLLSHLHFQFGEERDDLLQNGKLINPTWYATMCAGDGTLLDRCNIVRALHKLPCWKQLPDTPCTE